MKRIVDGIVYNTATAQLIGEWRNTLDIQNSNWCHEMLFLNSDGAYFLWGCGGSLSPYNFCNNTIRGSKADITPLSIQKAKVWAKEHLRYEVYIKEFEKHECVA